MKVDLSGILSKELEKARKEYDEAVSSGDTVKAKRSAGRCADILKNMAECLPSRRDYYIETARQWERISSGKAVPVNKRKQNRPVVDESQPSDNESGEFLKRADALIAKTSVTWDDIGGLDRVKRLLMETVVIAGLQKPASIKPWKGVLLFGPPGTGKTLLASAAAGSLNATFFDVKSESVLSKYFGESSKLISALYDSARNHAPSIVFMDEFDSLSQSRGEGSTEATRKVLSSLLTNLDGLQDKKSDKLILTLAATNTPWDLDTASLSRFPRRIYVTLPDERAIEVIIKIQMKDLEFGKINLKKIASECVLRRYSGRDLQSFCQQSIWHMIHDKNPNLHKMASLSYEELNSRKLKTRPLIQEDFSQAFEKIKSPVTEDNLLKFKQWNAECGERC